MTLPSAIQLLLGDDRTFAIKSTALVGPIRHLHRLESRNDRAYSSFGEVTTRKWSIPDAKKDVGIKNVGNKGFPDAVNNASGDASRKQSFPTYHEGVGKNTSGKG
ncbi:hypothetical protein E5676_scaffold409G00380 [Cucumis melo var. makuwa]|uniref:Uncharacterized protein n=1 Tax=Cucumis melo var. makuwa TaxID=1194695 RepID=A0A5A7SKR7_CUCMM|nr:hypothetical protein E6C27_scaffold139G004530 [Cucumis melo var. makuwa]TYK04439.1 hypothetical protein E5676_scaffold409G00380 [Cucumis melo var. makuwa]